MARPFWPPDPFVPVASVSGEADGPAAPVPQSARRRMTLLLVFVSVGLAAVFGRLAWLQLMEADAFRELRARQTSGTQTHEKPRMKLALAGGVTVAETVSCPSLFVEPQKIRDKWSAAVQLGTALRRSPTTLLPFLEEHVAGTATPCRFRWIKRRLATEEVARVRAFDIPGVGFRDEPLRVYPCGGWAAQILGGVGVDGQGLDGLELQMDAFLRGARESEAVLRDARMRAIALTAGGPERRDDALAVQLTLHHGIQTVMEEELDRLMEEHRPSWACAVAIDPATGDVVAMGSRPTFDPNAFSRAAPDSRRLRCITDSYEPGSTFKPFVLGALIEEGLIRLDDVIDCENGLWSVGGRRLHDHHPYARLSVLDVIAKSSNIGAAKLGLLFVDKRGVDPLRRYLGTFGFGERTGIPLPGESAGHVPAAAGWSIYTSTSVPIGHEIAVTPIQMARAFSLFANGGYRVEPRIVRGIADGRGRLLWSPPSSPPRRVLRAETVAQVRQALESVVETGTARTARLAGYPVAGKTGTSQKYNPRTKRYDGGYIASFVAFAPADDARLCVLVVADDPKGGDYYGGKVAAPVVARILERSLQLLEIPPRAEALARTPAAGR